MYLARSSVLIGWPGMEPDSIAAIRSQLRLDLERAISEIEKELPSAVLEWTLEKILGLKIFPPALPKVRSVRSSTIAARQSNAVHNGIRRITRSMAIADRKQTMVSNVCSVAATPKFHPGLPETPATVRRRHAK